MYASSQHVIVHAKMCTVHLLNLALHSPRQASSSAFHLVKSVERDRQHSVFPRRWLYFKSVLHDLLMDFAMM